MDLTEAEQLAWEEGCQTIGGTIGLISLPSLLLCL